MPGPDLTDIRSERIASNVEERHIAFPIIAGIVGFALVVAYAGYCFYSTAEMIKPEKKAYEKLGIDLPLSFEKSPPAFLKTLRSAQAWSAV
jgi:hypothetical protein